MLRTVTPVNRDGVNALPLQTSRIADGAPMLRSLILTTTLALTLAGCASQTPYQPAEKRGAEGYAETRLTENRYRVTFTGNSLTPADTVKDYALLRAGELTLQLGYDWFQLANSSNDKKVQSVTTVGGGYDPLGETAVYQRCGLIRCSTTVVTTPGFIGADVATSTASTAYSSSLEIVMGRKPMPANVETYDAHELVASLRGLIAASQRR